MKHDRALGLGGARGVPVGRHGLKGGRIVVAIGALALVLAGSVAGPTGAGQGSARPADAAATLRAPPAVATAEVAGSDLPGLPRYPGSIRTGFRQGPADGLLVTDVEYLARAEPDAVREFYRAVFRSEGWTVVDVRFARGEWRFFVVQGVREALIQIRDGASGTRIPIRLSEPAAREAARPAPAAGGAAVAAAPP